jgi:hypothetical protein
MQILTACLQQLQVAFELAYPFLKEALPFKEKELNRIVDAADVDR